MTFLSGQKIPFSRRKFLMAFFSFFSHRPRFSDFTFLYRIKCRLRPFLHQKTPYFRKEFLDKTNFFTLFVLSRASDYTNSLNIGGPMHVPSPSQTLGGPSPTVPLGLCPWFSLTS